MRVRVCVREREIRTEEEKGKKKSQLWQWDSSLEWTNGESFLSSPSLVKVGRVRVRIIRERVRRNGRADVGR